MAILESVIEIGATGIRLLVAQIQDSDTDDGKFWSVLDSSELPVSLGRDVFITGTISRDTMLQCIRVLNRFREQIATWAIPPEEITVIATSALRNAKNKDAVLDRIKVKTGFTVKVIDGIEQNKLTYLAVSEAFRNQSVTLEGINSVILEIGGGATDIMLIEQGQMAGVHTLRLGTIIAEQLISTVGDKQDLKRFLKEFIRVTRKSLDNEMNFTNIQQFIALGAEAEIAGAICGVSIAPKIKKISRDDFDNLVAEIQNYTAEECVARFKISRYDAQALHIGLLAYQVFLDFTHVKEILVLYTNTREGLIVNTLHKPDKALQKKFYQQITASAWNLAKKYRVDEKHAETVRRSALKLFNELQTDLGLDPDTRILLETAAILHDIGMFIRADDHHIHSAYVINHSDIFGLTREQIDIISQIAYNHRGNHSPQEMPQFLTQPRSARVAVLKLTDLIRIADALDRGHSGQINDFKITVRDENLIIHCNTLQDLSLEKRALAEKANIFEDVFGYKVILG